jgi:hypothetical protein
MSHNDRSPQPRRAALGLGTAVGALLTAVLLPAGVANADPTVVDITEEFALLDQAFIGYAGLDPALLDGPANGLIAAVNEIGAGIAAGDNAAETLDIDVINALTGLSLTNPIDVTFTPVGLIP